MTPPQAVGAEVVLDHGRVVLSGRAEAMLVPLVQGARVVVVATVVLDQWTEVLVTLFRVVLAVQRNEVLVVLNEVLVVLNGWAVVLPFAQTEVVTVFVLLAQ